MLSPLSPWRRDVSPEAEGKEGTLRELALGFSRVSGTQVPVGHAASRGVCGAQISSLQNRVAGGAPKEMKSVGRGADVT